jgi:preprotein translocase subunit YajC
MSKKLLFAIITATALTFAFAQQAAPPAATGAATKPAPAQAVAPVQTTTPVQGTAPAQATTPPQGTAPIAPTPGGGNFLTGLLPIALIFVVFYFLLIMPQQRQRKKHVAMLSALKPGDRVVVLGGVHGVITRLKEGTVMVKIADSTEIEVDRSSVSYKVGGEQTK